MAEAPDSLEAMAAEVRRLLSSEDLSALAPLLHEHVTWGTCAGRAEVSRFIEAAAAGGARAHAVRAEALDDRVIVSFRLGDGDGAPTSHQALFVEDDHITEICDASSDAEARSLDRVGTPATMLDRPVRIDSAAAIFAVRDIASAIEHYRALGFTVHAYEGDAAYGFADRDGVSLHLAQVSELDPATNTSAAYLYTDDADALSAQWRLSGAGGRHVAPVDTEYGLREGAHVDPDGNLMRFGSRLDRPS